MIQVFEMFRKSKNIHKYEETLTVHIVLLPGKNYIIISIFH